jgi:hypothetical protein
MDAGRVCHHTHDDDRLVVLNKLSHIEKNKLFIKIHFSKMKDITLCLEM